MPLGPQGVTVMGVHIGDDVINALVSTVDTGASFPVLIDYESGFLNQWGRVGEGVYVFPLAYLIDKQGVIRNIFTQEEPAIADLKAEVEALLAE